MRKVENGEGSKDVSGKPDTRRKLIRGFLQKKKSVGTDYRTFSSKQDACEDFCKKETNTVYFRRKKPRVVQVTVALKRSSLLFSETDLSGRLTIIFKKSKFIFLRKT